MALLRACPKCGRLTESRYCPNHQPKPWATKQGRGNRMRSGSREQRINRAVMLEHDGICHICGKHGADEVDHVIPLAEGGTDVAENRRPIHSKPCHQDKTAAEAQRGKQ